MAWAETSVGVGSVLTETSTLPSSATTEYSSEIDNNNIKPNLANNNKYISGTIQASAVSGTNLDIGLYGAHSSGGTKFLLKDAIVADITDGTLAVFTEDINALPAPFYYIGWTSDADESANTVTVSIFGSR